MITSIFFAVLNILAIHSLRLHLAGWDQERPGDGPADLTVGATKEPAKGARLDRRGEVLSAPPLSLIKGTKGDGGCFYATGGFERL